MLYFDPILGKLRTDTSLDIMSQFYQGVAQPSTNPTTPVRGDYWRAGIDGTYTNFSGLIAQAGDLLAYSGSVWELVESSDLSSYADRAESKRLFRNWPLADDQVCTRAMTNDMANAFWIDLMIFGGNPSIEYSARIVRRNDGGAWQVRIYRDNVTSDGIEVLQYIGTSEPASGIELITFTTQGGSGMTGYALVNWLGIPDGFADTGMWASVGYKFDPYVMQDERAAAIRALLNEVVTAQVDANVYNPSLNNSILTNAISSLITGSRNTGQGIDIFTGLTSGDDNTALGNKVLELLTTGISNTGAGSNSFAALISGDQNSAFGNYALTSSIDGVDNVAVGASSQYFSTHAQRNNSLGSLSFYRIIDGHYSCAFGFESTRELRYGMRNAAYGYKTAHDNTMATDLTAIGYKALEINTPQNGAITAYADAGGGNTTVTSAGHGLSNGDSVIIRGSGLFVDHDFTDNYDGTHTISNVSTDTYQIAVAYITPGLLAGFGWWAKDGEAIANTAVGYYAAGVLQKGSRNVAIGFNAQLPDVDGNDQMSIQNAFYGDLANQYFGTGGVTQPDTGIHNGHATKHEAQSADPADPDPGQCTQWLSDGTGSGDAGDVMIKINVGGTVKTITLVDYSTH